MRRTLANRLHGKPVYYRPSRTETGSHKGTLTPVTPQIKDAFAHPIITHIVLVKKTLLLGRSSFLKALFYIKVVTES